MIWVDPLLCHAFGCGLGGGTVLSVAAGAWLCQILPSCDAIRVGPERSCGSPPGQRTPTASLGQSSRRVKDQAVRPWRHCLGASLPRRCGRPVGVGFFAVLPMASPASSLSRSALKARDALVLEHLPLADVIASAAARRLFPLVERDALKAKDPLRCSGSQALLGHHGNPWEPPF